MNSDFASTMREATNSVRAQNLAKATALIQQALAGRKGGTAGSASALAIPSLLEPPTVAAATAGQPSGQAPFVPSRGPRMRRPLGEVVRMLRDGRRPAGILDLPFGAATPAAPAPLPALPDGAQFLARSLDCPAGTRSYRLYVPNCRVGELRGLVVMLHGCKQTPEDFATGTRMNAQAEESRLLVAYPGQMRAANVSGCWNWFDPAHQARDAGEPAIIAAITREIAAEFGIPQDRVFIAGLSAGGAMAVVMGETYPELYAGVGIHSGLAYGSANDVMSAFVAMRGQGRLAPVRSAGKGPRPRMIVFHGSADTTVSPSNAGGILAAAQAALPDGILHEERNIVADGRVCDRTIIMTLDGAIALELWMIDGAGHAWSGGHPGGPYTDPRGPDASAEMVRFFMNDM